MSTNVLAAARAGSLPARAGAAYSLPMRLLEREVELAALERTFAVTRAGAGAGAAISGESGAGKSALVDAAVHRAPDIRVLRVGCDPLSTPRPLGPIRDLLADLRSTEVMESLQTVCELTFTAVRTEPTILVVEDVHWIDTASADVLRFLVRRLGVMACALVITYRDEEIAAQHPARPLLGELAATENVAGYRLSPLSLAAVATLVDGSQVPERVHQVTGGNPFFVAEVAKEPLLPLPLTVRDAVLARLAAIAAADLEVLQLAAAAPDRVDDRTLPALGVDYPTLLRLHDTGLLRRDQHGIVFRHELSRLAVESTIPPGGLRRLHARLLEALESITPRDPAVLTHHAVAAGDHERTVRYAQDAASQAVRAGSHTEAAAFLQTALEHLGDDSAAERAKLQLQLGTEQYMTSRLPLAIASIEKSFPLWRSLHDRGGLSAAHESCAVLEYYNADRDQAEHHADRATELAPDAAGLAYGAARVTRAYLAYHRGEYELSGLCSTDGLRIAQELDDEALTLRGSLVQGLTDLSRDEQDARRRCLGVVDRARDSGLDELASTGYSNVGYLDVEQGRLGAAERLLEISLPFTVERDIPICRHWQTAVRSRLRFREGRWSAALEDADQALGSDGMPLARFWPLMVRGLVALRCDGAVGDLLDSAWTMAVQLDEPLRIVPALSALAEQMWLTGTPDDRVTTAWARVKGFPDTTALAWSLGDLAVWSRRLGLEPAIEPARMAEPYRLSLLGSHREAADWWHRAGAVFEEAMACADSTDTEDRVRAIERLDGLGATATADSLRLTLRRDGVTVVPIRPRASTRANPSGLTNRQLEVAKLVARGFTNSEVAERLFISLRTTDHHVSAVLAKLGLPNRRALMVQATELGLG